MQRLEFAKEIDKEDYQQMMSDLDLLAKQASMVRRFEQKKYLENVEAYI